MSNHFNAPSKDGADTSSSIKDHTESNSNHKLLEDTYSGANRQQTSRISVDTSSLFLPSVAITDNRTDDEGKRDSRILMATEHEIPASRNLETERQHLLDLTDNRVLWKQENSWMKYSVQKFEDRAKEANMPPGEVAETMHQVSRLLEKSSGATLSDRARVRLALGVMHDAASPTDNDQGAYGTCGFQALENRLYTKEPSIPAKMIADVALKGLYAAQDGTIIAPDRESLGAHGDSARNDYTGLTSDIRKYAGQLFDLVTANLYYSHANGESDSFDAKSFIQRAPKTLTKSGDAVVNQGDNRIVYDDAPGIGSDRLALVSAALTGRYEPEAFLQKLRHPNTEHQDAAGGESFFKSADELGDKLQKLKESGKLPAVLSLDTQNELFYPYPPISNPLMGGHVITVTDYDAATRTVKYDNQWGASRDRTFNPVSLDELYKATDVTPASDWLKRFDVARNFVTKDHLANALIGTMYQYAKHWDFGGQEGTLDTEDRTKALAQYQKLLSTLDTSTQEKIRSGIKRLIFLDGMKTAPTELTD